MDKVKKAKIYGTIIYYFVKIVNLTLKTKIVSDEEYVEGKQYIYGFWHQNLFIPMVNMTKNGNKIANMISPSKDGEIIAKINEKYGYVIIRASSNKDSVRGLVEMIKKIRDGYSGGFAADGPKGPIYKVKPGIAYVAQKSGVEIVPLGGASSKKWVFKNSWDKMEIPKPFAKAVYYIGKPIKITKEVNIDEILPVIDEKINEAMKKAQEIVDGMR